MAETDVSHEFGREPGFSRLVFEWFLPWQFHMLHSDHSYLGQFDSIFLQLDYRLWTRKLLKTTSEGQIFADSYLQLSKPLQATTGKADQTTYITLK